ncbi:hypothetical protein CBM2585_B80225 [Cupriavidus taiwanensis]|nr:hypothetical protein CBM2585_B80225 [Cupriavidus taiwanensis]
MGVMPREAFATNPFAYFCFFVRQFESGEWEAVVKLAKAQIASIQ